MTNVSSHMRRRLRMLALSTAITAGCGLAVPASAQDLPSAQPASPEAPTAAVPGEVATGETPPASAATPAESAADAQEPSAPAFGGDIIVTASKRSQTVNKTSVAVTALGQQQLAASGVVEVQDLTSAVPNVQIHTLGPAGYSGVTIRGISNQDFSQLGSPAVATYLDGIYVATSQALPGGLYDLERLEVLRGPQGTTYGQNATGGNVNVFTADPKHSFGASADLSYGNFNDVQAHAMVNLPVSDTLAVRGGFFIHRSDGYFDNRGTTARNYGADDVLGWRLTGLWTPSTAFKWKLVLERFVNKGTPPNMLQEIGPDGDPITGRDPFDQPFVGPHAEPKVDLKSYSLRSRMDLRLSDTLSAAYIAGYQTQRSTYDFAILGVGSRAAYDGRWFDKVSAYSNELNINFDNGRFQNILGVSQFHKSNPFYNAFHFYVFGIDEIKPGYAAQSAFGVFDQATFAVIDGVRVIGGIRWSRESQNTKRAYDTINCSQPTDPYRSFEEITQLTANTPGCAPVTVPYAQGTWSNVSWKAGAEWDINNRTLAYATVTNGFKSGQVQQTQLPPGFPPTVSPEELTNYEVGLKTRVLGNTLNLRTAIFNMEYKDIQVTKVGFADNTPIVTVQNAGRARIYGAEVEFNYQPSSIDHINGFVTYTHATYTDYQNAYDGITGTAVADLNGNFLPNAPEFTAKVDYSHDLILGNGGTVTPMASFYYQTKNFLREFNNRVDRVGAYTRTDLNLTYANASKRWTVTAYVTNLEDRAIRNSANTALNRYFSDYLPPRQFGVRASFAY